MRCFPASLQSLPIAVIPYASESGVPIACPASARQRLGLSAGGNRSHPEEDREPEACGLRAEAGQATGTPDSLAYGITAIGKL